MRSFVWTWTESAAALLALAAVATAAGRPGLHPHRADQDFEFDDDADSAATSVQSHRPRRYVYDPHNSLCHSLVCKKREVCVLRDAFTALCATKKELLRKGDIIVPAGAGGGWDAEGREWERDDDDVFYDGAARDSDADTDLDADDIKPNRCVGCPARTRAQFLCGSDNRTYSSLCRLDLHNCVRRSARPVRLACRGFCPCARPRRRGRARIRPRNRARLDDYDDDWRSSTNEVIQERPTRRRPAKGTEGCALDKMANRLLDWFSVLMDEASATAPPMDGFPGDCKPEVRWMFAHLDTDGDGLLSAANLYSLRHDERERCLRPFLASCGSAESGGVSRAAWCGCLRRAARPCTALARAHPDAHSGAYVPSCDERGFYRARQCHAALGVCWCVDAHGVEQPGSRTKGAPACPVEKSVGGGEENAEGAPSDDEDGAGSGDAELHF